MDKQLLAINEIVIEDEKRINHLFIKEAIGEWDKVGSFPLYISLYIDKKWQELVRLN